jgi:hypothetical protein
MQWCTTVTGAHTGGIDIATTGTRLTGTHDALITTAALNVTAARTRATGLMASGAKLDASNQGIRWQCHNGGGGGCDGAIDY